MKRALFLLTTATILVLIVWGLCKMGGTSSSSRQEPAPVSIGQVKNADPLDTPAGWRYRQNTPRHWRYIMLQK